MTKERIYEILRENGYDELSPDDELMTSIKQIVNEALEEAADSLTTIGSVDQNQDLFFKHHKDANKKRILNLKVI